MGEGTKQGQEGGEGCGGVWRVWMGREGWKGKGPGAAGKGKEGYTTASRVHASYPVLEEHSNAS